MCVCRLVYKKAAAFSKRSSNSLSVEDRGCVLMPHHDWPLMRNRHYLQYCAKFLESQRCDGEGAKVGNGEWRIELRKGAGKGGAERW
eukprot:4935068-Pleurochrysis_carterae.AAC.1